MHGWWVPSMPPRHAACGLCSGVAFFWVAGCGVCWVVDCDQQLAGCAMVCSFRGVRLQSRRLRAVWWGGWVNAAAPFSLRAARR